MKKYPVGFNTRVTENHEDEYNGYFAIVSKGVFMNTVMNKKVSGKISLGV